MASTESSSKSDVKSSERPIIDSSHELFLDPADDPTQVLVNRLFDGSNYGQWKKSMEVELAAKNKLGFVHGTCKRPDTDPFRAALWDRCNCMVMCWILRAVNKQIYGIIIYSDTAHQMWKDLEEIYGQVSGIRMFLVLRELSTISQADLSVSAYYDKIKNLWDEYDSMVMIPFCESCNCGSHEAIVKLMQEKRLMQFLAGLNDDYKMIRGNILLMEPLPSMKQAYHLVLEEERKIKLHSLLHFNSQSAGLLSNASFVMRGNMLSSGRQKFWNQPGNNRNRPKENQRDWRYYFCDHCEMSGHTISKCYKLHGYPPGHKLYKGKKMAGAASLEQDS